MSDPPAGVSNRRFAELDGCTEKRVRTGKLRGELKAFPDGTIDPALAGTGWRQRNRVADSPRLTADAKRKPGAPTLAEEQRRREIALARLRQQEWAKRSAEWVLRPDVDTMWQALAAHTHEAIRASIPALTACVAKCSTMGAMAGAVRDVVYDTLTAIAETAVESTTAEAEPLPAVSDTASKLEAETVKVGALASLRQLDVDIAKGIVVSISDVEYALGEAFARVRQRMLSLEALLPPRLHGARLAGREQVIRRAIQEALDELPLHPVLPGSPPPPDRAAPAAHAASNQ
jgi:hypothetical protein